MQPVVAQRGVSTKSQLFDSLKVYLNNKNRLQPIIGLGSIIECVKAGTHNREALYLCEVCVCRLSKADLRNHIMGSLHRYNYIKAWYPHLVSEWKETSDLSKQAWSLMEIARLLEGKEGPGDVQLFEVEDAVYQMMATHSENDAVTLINILRDGQGEPESHSETTPAQLQCHPIQSQRIVLLGQNQRRCSKKSLKTSVQTNKPPSLMWSTVAPPVGSEGWLNDTPTSLLDNAQTSPGPSVLSKNNSFLDGYTGNKPLIGLFHLVECRSEDGHTYCFLCHCCRIRSNKKDIIDHLTSSSHLRNYLMETHPEQVEVEMADINGNYQLLLSLAEKVEQEEGRGELKVVIAPESLCILLTDKSYHWCIKMLCNGQTHTNIQKRKMAVKGPSVTKTSNGGMPVKCAVVLSKCAKGMTAKTKRKRKRKVTDTVFKVSLPLTKGSVLLERTSFSVDSLPVSSAYSTSPDSNLSLSPQSQSEDCDLVCDSGSFAVNHVEHTSTCTPSQLQQDRYSGDGDAGQYMGPERNLPQYKEMACGGDRECFYQSEDMTWTKEQRSYEELNYNRQHGSQERSNVFYKEWQKEGPQTQSEGLSPAVSHIQDWSSYNSSYGLGESCTEQSFNSTSQSNAGLRVEVSREERQREMSSECTQYYSQQQPQNQHMARDHMSLLTGSVVCGSFGRQHGLSGELAPHLDAARSNMYPYVGDPRAHSGSIAAEPTVHLLGIEQRRWLTYMDFPFGRVQTAPQSSMPQPTTYQATDVGHEGMFNPNYNTGPRTNPDQHFPHPSVLWGPLWS